ncbi:MAG TPA: hypothetical protein VGJ22_13070 [Anaerolineales bacterium]
MTIPSLPQLKILPLNRLILHEDHDRQRTLPLLKRLRAQGILRNPPVVMPLADRSQRYMVLDGANRVTALQEMDFPHIVAQVVEAGQTQVGLQTWNHVVWGMSARTLLAHIRKVPGVTLKRVDAARSVPAPTGPMIHIRLADGALYLAHLPAGLIGQVRALHGIVNCYKQRASLDRTSQTLINSFRRIYSDLTALIIFPRFDITTVLRLAGKKSVLPTGITRFTVSPRALHINYPLHELSSGKTLADKEAYLEEWLRDRVKEKGMRYYAEATFLFDE